MLNWNVDVQIPKLSIWYLRWDFRKWNFSQNQNLSGIELHLDLVESTKAFQKLLLHSNLKKGQILIKNPYQILVIFPFEKRKMFLYLCLLGYWHQSCPMQIGKTACRKYWESRQSIFLAPIPWQSVRFWKCPMSNWHLRRKLWHVLQHSNNIWLKRIPKDRCMNLEVKTRRIQNESPIELGPRWQNPSKWRSPQKPQPESTKLFKGQDTGLRGKQIEFLSHVSWKWTKNR